MAEIRIDSSELRTLAADLGNIPDRAIGQVRATTQRAAFNIKKQMIEEATGASQSFDRVRYSITYETWENASGIGAEIGPETGYAPGHAKAQGGLAWIAYEGHATTGPVFPDPAGAAEREASAWERYLLAAVIGDLW